MLGCVSAALLGGLVSFLSTEHSVSASEQQPYSSSSPFSAVFVIRQYSPDGKLALTSTWNYYRFSDGSYATGGSRQLEPGQRPLVDNIVDLRSQRDLMLEPVTKSVITFKRSPGEQENAMQGMWEENCPTNDSEIESTEPGEIFFGYPTVHVVKHFDPTWKEDRWMIRDLRCFSVKEIDIAGASRDETIVTSLALGEPPRSVLSAPEDFVERSPFEVAKAYALATGGSQLFSAQALKKLTREYGGPTNSSK